LLRALQTVLLPRCVISETIPARLGCRLLRDYEPPTWRVRIGDWRVLYEINDDAGVVTVAGVRHRSKAY
jgi:mRNA-degrading endonuclease RelE of RelBE toxin-antitoxin system